MTESVLAYATYASGYKSGGVQYGVFVPGVGLAFGGDGYGFDKEELEMFEVGIKSRLMNDRIQLNSALFQYDYTNQQVQSVVIIDGVANGLTQNAGESTMNGFELELVALLTDQLQINASYSYLDAEYDKFDSATGSLAGNKMIRSPENAYNIGLQFDTAIGDFGDLQLMANYSWKDEFYFDFANTPGTIQDSYGLVALNAIWRLPNQATSLRLFCENCSDEEYALEKLQFPSGTAESYAPLRRYGIEIAHNF